MRPLPIALALLLLALTWRTEAFQSWAFPERFYDARVQALVDNIAFQRAMIMDSRDELAALSAVSAPEEVIVYQTLRRGIEEDIHAAEDMIEIYQSDLELARATLSKLRRNF